LSSCAGKTTTLKILTGDIQPTSGYALLHGYDLREEPQEVRRYIGYCPQFDALHGLLTGIETLEFYARIRGIPERNISAMVNYLVDRLSLRVNANQPVQGYSGGTKRKLSVGVALIGSPPIVFLSVHTAS
jgi:ATP-binding cassette subfamily A (ABC1) protein 3